MYKKKKKKKPNTNDWDKIINAQTWYNGSPFACNSLSSMPLQVFRVGSRERPAPHRHDV